MTANERQSVHSPDGLFDTEFGRFIPYTDRYGATVINTPPIVKVKVPGTEFRI